MNVPLRKRDDDVVFPEQLVDAETNVAADGSQVPVPARVGPEVGVENQGVVAKSSKTTLGFGSSSTPSCSMTAWLMSSRTWAVGDP